jgi:hypothetical protein
MSNLSRIHALAFVFAFVACGGTAETGSEAEQLGTESQAVAKDPACPKRAPLPGTGCLPDHLSCTYHTDQCPHGSLTSFSCETNGSNLAWSAAKCTAPH